MNKYLSEFKQALQEARILKLVVLVLVILVILEFYLVGKLVTNQKIIIVPENLNKRITISGSEADYNLVEVYGRNIINAYYSFIPETVEKQYRYIISYFTPEAYNKYSGEFISLARKYAKNNASQIGYIKDIQLSKDKITAKVLVNTFIGETKTASFLSNIEIGYKIDNFKFVITSFKETVEKQQQQQQEEENNGG